MPSAQRLFVATLVLAFAGIVLGALPALPPPPSRDAAPSPRHAPEPIQQWHGSYGGDPMFSVRAVYNEAGWQSLWQRLQKYPPHPLDVPAKMAVYIALGRRPTGGYTDSVASAVVGKDRLIVTYREARPSPDTYVTEAITFPWVIAVLPRSHFPVVFQRGPDS